MNFFTAQWWFVDCQSANPKIDPDQAFTKYNTYLKSINKQLPSLPDFFITPIGLHDFEIRECRLDRDELEIDLIEPKNGFKKTLSLKGVLVFNKEVDQNNHSDYQTESIGYHELALGSDKGTVVVSFICNTGSEITVECALKKFEIELKDSDM